MNHKTYFLSLKIFCLVTVLQCGNTSFSQDAYPVIAAYSNQVKTPGNLSLTVAPYKGKLYSLENTLTPDFLQRHLNKAVANPDSFLSSTDYNFMKEQIATTDRPETFDKKNLEKHNVLFIHSLDEGKEYNSVSGILNKATWPLFSRDGNKAIVYIENFCGQSCQSGSAYIFERSDSKHWKIVTSILLWTE